MTEDDRKSLLEGIDHWEGLANKAEADREWDIKMGYMDPNPHSCPFTEQAKLYRRTAESLRLELKTGEWHCACHLFTRDQCDDLDRRRVK